MFVSVAVPVPSLPLLTYRASGGHVPVRGARALVPLGARTITGLIVATDVNGAETDVREILDVLDDTAFLPEEIVDLGLWVSEYYMASPGDSLAAAMPPGAWVESERRYQLTRQGRETAGSVALEGGEARVIAQLARGSRTLRALTRGSGTARIEPMLERLAREGLVERVTSLTGRARAFKTTLTAQLTPAGLSLAAAASVAPDPTLGTRQLGALAALAAATTPVTAADLRQRGVDVGAVRRLAARGLARLSEDVSERDPFAAGEIPTVDRDEQRELTDEQQAAVNAAVTLLDRGEFHALLLHGVTGSGKTEVYIRLARHAIGLGRRVLMLVPEIALTPQVAAQFRAAFGERVAIQHSGLAGGQRHDQWHRIRRGAVDLVVGTRSAVFAPVGNLGLVIVDEEHDASYKQEESPRYNGRDVAVMRAREAGALAVLGSATPALETYFNAAEGRYHRVELQHRVLDRPLASVRIVDLREEYAASGPDTVLSVALIDAIGRRLADGEQSLLLLNRRGFATSVLCRQCGHVLDCPNCSVTLTVHRRAQPPSRGVCHYCNYSVRVPSACVRCAAPYLEQVGFGTDRVLAEVERLFPGVRAARVDRDTMQRRGAIQDVLSRFGRGDLDLLVGTQMIAKGHDFPRVTLVGVVSADLGLGVADFRAAERTFQLLTQVAGRAGRGDTPGQAIIQTIHPEHYSIVLATRQDYQGFFKEELRYRRAMAYPPAVGLISVIVRGPSYPASMQQAIDLADALRRGSHGAFALLGPAPAPLAKLRGEYRTQMFLKTRHRTATRAALRAALDAVPDVKRRVTIDVDPTGLL